MKEHSEALDWAASWFRWLSKAAIVVMILGALGQFYSASQTTYINAAFNTPTLQFITAIGAIGTIITGLLVFFLFRVGAIICDFLADFARGLLSQQVAREHRMSESNK